MVRVSRLVKRLGQATRKIILLHREEGIMNLSTGITRYGAARFPRQPHYAETFCSVL